MTAVTLTPEAIQYVNEIRKSEAREGQCLRMRIMPGGCSGFSYHLGWDEQHPTEQDQRFVFDDVTVVVDEISLRFVAATEIHYQKGLYGGGFEFRNPNASGSCGCGQSFSV